MTRDVWLEGHPYLQPVADVQSLVEAAAAGIDVPRAPIPDWDHYAADFHAGVPLLRSSTVAFDFSAVETAVRSLIRSLASASLPEPLAAPCRDLEAEIETTDSRSPAHPGLLRYLGWVVLVRYLAPVVSAFDAWRDEERWLRNYCPTCGEPPTMAQLVGKDPGPPAHAVVRPLPHPLALQPHRLSVLRSAGRHIAWQWWRSKARRDCASTTATRVAAISRPTTARGARASCSPTGRHSTST